MTQPRGLTWRVLLLGLLLCLFLTGLIARAAPVLDRDGRLLRQFPAEDGYLMLTIARNIAIGKGMTVSDGAVATNGTQPLVTMLWAVLYKLSGGDKVAGVRLVLIASIVISSLTAWVIFLLGRRVYKPLPGAAYLAAVAALLWYASPPLIRHTMNAQETGAYLLIVTVVMFVFLVWYDRRERLHYALLMGLLLGLAFWIRNDAVLLAAAIGIAWTLLARLDRDRSPSRVVTELLLVGFTTLAIAAPWLIYNKLNFGHIVPNSGIAEGYPIHFAANLRFVPAKLVEYITVIYDIDPKVEDSPLSTFGFLIIAGAFALAVGWLYRQRDSDGFRFLSLSGVFTMTICIFYGLFFNAPWFLSRFLSPLSPSFVILTIGLAAYVMRFLWRIPLGRVAVILPAFLTLIVVHMNIQAYTWGDYHMHFQVIEWVEENVPDDVWVAAIQTGTLGYFHERTINLDGKVDPAALEARITGQTEDYVLSTPARYIVDWVDLVDILWMGGGFNEHWEKILENREQNIAVLMRKDPP
ncbi:MAG: glycosyltransferase family 39 protein [Caldilineales bacterium]|nr:glycosyltransferase family 39 protein [Caldilineales bacterium]